MGVVPLINHGQILREICGTVSSTSKLKITKHQLTDAITQFYSTYMYQEEQHTDNQIMDSILHDLHHLRGYHPSPFQQKCFSMFIRICAPIIFSGSRNNVAEYTRLLTKYGIKAFSKRMGVIETSRRMGKSQALKIFGCVMAKNLPGLRVVYVSKDGNICDLDYSETLGFAKAVGATTDNKQGDITFRTSTGQESHIRFYSGHAPDVSFFSFFINIFFFAAAAVLNHLFINMCVALNGG